MPPRLLSLVAFSLTTSAMTVLPLATAGDLYKWTDEKGRVHYSSTPPPETVKKAATIDSSKLSNVNALPNDPHKARAEGNGPADSSGPSSWTPTETASSDNSAKLNAAKSKCRHEIYYCFMPLASITNVKVLAIVKPLLKP